MKQLYPLILAVIFCIPLCFPSPIGQTRSKKGGENGKTYEWSETEDFKERILPLLLREVVRNATVKHAFSMRISTYFAPSSITVNGTLITSPRGFGLRKDRSGTSSHNSTSVSNQQDASTEGEGEESKSSEIPDEQQENSSGESAQHLANYSITRAIRDYYESTTDTTSPNSSVVEENATVLDNFHQSTVSSDSREVLNKLVQNFVSSLERLIRNDYPKQREAVTRDKMNSSEDTMVPVPANILSTSTSEEMSISHITDETLTPLGDENNTLDAETSEAEDADDGNDDLTSDDDMLPMENSNSSDSIRAEEPTTIPGERLSSRSEFTITPLTTEQHTTTSTPSKPIKRFTEPRRISIGPRDEKLNKNETIQQLAATFMESIRALKNRLTRGNASTKTHTAVSQNHVIYPKDSPSGKCRERLKSVIQQLRSRLHRREMGTPLYRKIFKDYKYLTSKNERDSVACDQKLNEYLDRLAFSTVRSLKRQKKSGLMSPRFRTPRISQRYQRT